LEVPFNIGSSKKRILQTVASVNVKVEKQVVVYKSGALSANAVALEPSIYPPTSYDELSNMLRISPRKEDMQGTRYVI